MVQRIGGCGSDLESNSFSNRNRFEQRKRYGLRPRPDDGADGRIANSPDVIPGFHEGSGIDPLRNASIRRIERHSRDDIRPAGARNIDRVVSRRINSRCGDGEKRSGLEQQDSRDLPSADDGIHRPIGPRQKRALSAKRQFVEKRREPAIAAGIGNDAVVKVDVVNVAYGSAALTRIATGIEALTIRQVLCERVAHQVRETFA